MAKKKILTICLSLALLAAALSGCAGTVEPSTRENAGIRLVTDMAGREVELPQEIGMVYAADSVAPIFLYTLAPEKLLGWSYELNNIEKAVILPQYHELPNFGMKDAVNYEAVIAAAPTIAIQCGTINDKLVSECDALSRSLGIPVLALDSDLLKTADAYRFLGAVLGMEDRAEQLAEYCDATFRDIAAMEIREEDRVRVYYGNGEDSLETAPAGSSHGQLLDLVRAVNVADLELGDGSRVQISAEQLLAWDPDVILVIGEAKRGLSGGAAAQALKDDSMYGTLKAVRERKIYGVPNAPFSWVDRPPGPNRIVGIRWLSGLLYPEHLKFDADEAVREFFHLFYHVELTEEMMTKLYAGTLGME